MEARVHFTYDSKDLVVHFVGEKSFEYSHMAPLRREGESKTVIVRLYGGGG